MISNGKVKAYSGQGNFLGNIIAFLVVFGALIASMFVLAFWTLETAWWPGLAFLALFGLSFFVAKEVMGRSDTLDQQDLHREYEQLDSAKATR